MYSYGPPHMAKQKQDDQLGHTYSSYVRIRDVTLKTSQKLWMIGRSGGRGSEISVLETRLDDDDDDDVFICFCFRHYIFIHIESTFCKVNFFFFVYHVRIFLMNLIVLFFILLRAPTITSTVIVFVLHSINLFLAFSIYSFYHKLDWYIVIYLHLYINEKASFFFHYTRTIAVQKRLSYL